MSYIYVTSGPSLLIDSTDSMIGLSQFSHKKKLGFLIGGHNLFLFIYKRMLFNSLCADHYHASFRRLSPNPIPGKKMTHDSGVLRHGKFLCFSSMLDKHERELLEVCG